MYIQVRVTPGAKKEMIVERTTNHYDISVKEEAERNQANRRLIEIIAGRFRVPQGKIRIISGHRSPSKILSVDALEPHRR